MGKNLFSDLTTDVSDKYKNKNDATIIAELTERIDAIVENLKRETREHLWAEVVIETYEQLYEENKDYIESVPSFKVLYELKKEADKFLKDEIAAVENAKIYQARMIDDKIKSLVNSAKGKFWCDELDLLIKEVNLLKEEIKVKCKKLDKIDQLKEIKERVLRALKLDDEIAQLEKSKIKTEFWCDSVTNLKSKLESTVVPYLTKKIVFDNLLSEAKVYLIEIKNKKAEEKKQEELKKQEEARKEAERKAKLYEEELIRQNEARRAEEQKKQDEIIKKGKEKLQKVIESCKDPSLEFKQEGEEVHLIKCTNTNLKKVIIPEGVDKISNAVFSDFSKLVTVTFPESLLSIGSYAFSNCKKLKEINLNGYLQEIGEYAFNNCVSLKSIYIGPKVKKISSTAFYDCAKLKEINVSSGSDTFNSERGNLYSKDKRALYRYCPANKRKDVLIYISVDYVHDYAFQGCKNIKSVNTNTASVFGSSVFADCVKLSKVKINNYLKVVGLRCFKNCKKLKSIKASSTVLTRGWAEDHFAGCDKLPKKYKNWLVIAKTNNQNYINNVLSKYRKYM